MDCQQAVISMSKYVAQAKELIVSYVNENPIADASYLQEAVKLLNIALDNVTV